MANLTNKHIEFLSNRELTDILVSVLNEIDIAASYGAHRSTTYLSVSAIEGIFGELLKLLRIQPGAAGWPSKKSSPKPIKELTLEEMIDILDAANALPSQFGKNSSELYDLARNFRNYMHPAKELKELIPINQSVGQLALACLNALIEKYSPLRFAAEQQWECIYGLAQVPADDIVHMPQNPADYVSLLVSKPTAANFQRITFHVVVPRDAIFNFVYNYASKDDFMAARIEGRGANGQAYDNGRLVCKVWRTWSITDRYVNEPDYRKQEHIVEIEFNSQVMMVNVDGIQLELERGDWSFDPQKKIGFMAEHGLISVLNLKIQ